jgi:acyl-CoA synthetase (AMP-forming)/AMP-acid ligase II
VVCLGIDAARGGVEPWRDLLAQARDVSDALLDAVSAEVEPTDDGLIIYTSGTTAKPKGVLHTQRTAVLRAPLRRLLPLHARRPRLHHLSVLLDRGHRDVDRRRVRRGRALLVQPTFEPAPRSR